MQLRVLEQEVTSPPPAAAALDLRNGDETVRIVRLRSAAATPLLLKRAGSRVRCPGLEDEDLERQSLYSLWRFATDIVPARRQTIEATTPAPSRASC